MTKSGAVRVPSSERVLEVTNENPRRHAPCVISANLRESSPTTNTRALATRVAGNRVDLL